MLLFYVRHGDPVYNPDSLTPLGHEQAKALAKRFATYGLDRVFCSPSVRAVQTAEPTCALLKKEMTVCPWADESLAFRDFSVSRPDGSSAWCFYYEEIVEIFRSPEVRRLDERWYEHPDLAKYDFGRGVARMNAAVDEFLLQLGFRHDRENARYEIERQNEQRVALFAHQGCGLAFLASVLDVPYPILATHFDLSHSSVSVINFSCHGRYVYPKVLQVSNDAHLYREGILTGYNNQIRF